jgi:hypothetical protein
MTNTTLQLKRKLKNLIIVTGLFIYQLQIAAQTTGFTGTWVLNLQKSQLQSPSPGLTGSKFIIKQNGEKFYLTRYHFFGNKKKKISFKMNADGKKRRVKILFKGKLERLDNNLKATIWRKNFSNIVTYRFGADQNEFIADETESGKYESHHHIWIFDREKPKTDQ